MDPRTVQINEWLARDYGYLESNPLWRISHSDNQYEYRSTDYTDKGVKMLRPEVRLLPKYKQWLHNQYILERILPVPEMQLHELPTRLSYEPVWAFQPGQHVRYDACQFIIKQVYKQAAERSGRKYVDPEENLGPVTNDAELLTYKKARTTDLYEYLFGNETDINTQLAYGEGVSLSGKKLESN